MSGQWLLVRPTVIVMTFLRSKIIVDTVVTIMKGRPSNPAISINFFFLLNRLNSWNIMRKRYDLICIVHDFASLKIKYGQLEHSPQTHFTGGEINVTLFCCKLDFRVQRLKNS